MKLFSNLLLSLFGFIFFISVSLKTNAQDPLAEYDPDSSASSWSWTLDLLLRYDHVRGLPDRSVESVGERARFGAHWRAENIEFDAVIEGTGSTASNRTDRINLKNERSNAGNIDTLALTWRPNDLTKLIVGKHITPITLSPLTWDLDLRPLGISLEHVIETSELTRLAGRIGYYNGNHLYEDESRISAAQLALNVNEGGAYSGFVGLSWLKFDDLEQLVRNGLARQNRRVGNQLFSDYRLLDLQAGMIVPLADKPLDLRIDLLRNTGADLDQNGARASAVWGTSRGARNWELGLSYQKIEREAALAAFNGDDWWFHADARGYMPWIAYGISDRWSVQVSQFIERRLSSSVKIDRTVIDFRGNF